MLLIIGNETGRLPNVAHLASHAQLKIAVAANRSALATALSTSRRNVVLFDEDELDAGLVTILAEHVGEAHLNVLVLCRKKTPQNYTRTMVEPIAKRVQWLATDVDHDELADRIRDLRNAMLIIEKSELVTAVRDNEFMIQYQPKVRWDAATDSWETAEVEALIRWRHPSYGLIGPRYFLPEAEEFGLMDEISELVLRATLTQLTKWESTGLVLGGSVNLSAKQLGENAELATRYSAIVNDYDMPTSRIVFELPATDVMAPERRAAIQNLREAGFRVALENFGAVADSREVFGAIEFDEMKIHATMFDTRTHDDRITKSLGALTHMAKNLGIEVCAQGVEDAEMFAFLESIHCDKLQGYLVSEAVMPEIVQHHYGGDGGEGDPVPDASFAYLI